MSEPVPSRWANLRDSCVALREMMIVTAMVALIVTPGAVRNVLERAGIKSVAGVEFDASTLAESQSELAGAQSQVTELKNQLALAQQQMSQLSAMPSTVHDERFTRVSRMLANAQRQAEATENSLDRSREKQQQVYRNLNPGETPGIADRPPTVPTTAQTQLVPPDQLFTR